MVSQDKDQFLDMLLISSLETNKHDSEAYSHLISFSLTKRPTVEQAHHQKHYISNKHCNTYGKGN